MKATGEKKLTVQYENDNVGYSSFNIGMCYVEAIQFNANKERLTISIAIEDDDTGEVHKSTRKITKVFSWSVK